MATTSLTTVCLACAKYSLEDGIIAKLLAYACMSPYIVLIWSAAIVYSELQLPHLCFFLGQGINIAISMLIKDILQHPRPAATCQALGRCHKFGMPSSHAAVMAYAASILILLHHHRYSVHHHAANKRITKSKSSSNNKKILQLIHTAQVGAVVLLAACTSYARVYLGYHSTAQVVAGAALGAMCALIAFQGTARLSKTRLYKSILKQLQVLGVTDTLLQ